METHKKKRMFLTHETIDWKSSIAIRDTQKCMTIRLYTKVRKKYNRLF